MSGGCRFLVVSLNNVFLPLFEPPKDVKHVCGTLQLEWERVVFERLDFGDLKNLDLFYNADVALVDMSVQGQQSALFYHIGRFSIAILVLLQVLHR